MKRITTILGTVGICATLVGCGGGGMIGGGTGTTTGPQAPTLVQHVSSTNTRDNFMSSPYCYHTQLPGLTTSGNAIVVGFTYHGNSVTPTVSDDKSDTYTIKESYYDSADTRTMAIAGAFGVTAGARAIKICFDTDPGGYTQPMVSELANVTGFDSAAGSGNNGSGTAITAGSVTPSASGEVMYQIASDFSGTLPWGLNMSSFMAGSQTSVGWSLLSADLRDGWAGQWGVYNATSSIAPSMSMGTSAHWATAAVMLKVEAAGGVPGGMRIVHLLHEFCPGTASTGTTFPNPYPVQFPSSGNLLVALPGGGNPLGNVTGVTDSQSNTWVQAGPTEIGGNNVTSIWYAVNPATTSTLSTNFTFNIDTTDYSIFLYDIAGAATTAPLDAVNAANGDVVNNYVPITPFTLTTTNAADLVLAQIIWDDNTANGCGSGCLFDANIFDGENINGPEPVDQNNGWGHFFTTSAGTVSFTWTGLDTSDPESGWSAIAAAFKSAGQ